MDVEAFVFNPKPINGNGSLKSPLGDLAVGL